MRLKLDENLDVGLVPWIESMGHDAESVRDEQMSGASDKEIFAAALAERRCLVTLDLDFSDPIRFSPSDSAGTIILRVPVPSMTMVRLLLEQAIARGTIESPEGQIWIVEPGRIRIWESWL
jgi:predicted nuclease of predicted toxin-antitoxin system